MKRPACLMKQFSLLEIASTAVLPAVVVVVVVDLSRVFHAVDSAALQVAHRYTPAPCGMLAVLPTIACTVRMFCHGEMLLSPHARRIVQHRDGTRRGNSNFRSTLCSALDLVSFPSGRTSVLGPELGTRLRFVD